LGSLGASFGFVQIHGSIEGSNVPGVLGGVKQPQQTHKIHQNTSKSSKYIKVLEYSGQNGVVAFPDLKYILVIWGV